MPKLFSNQDLHHLRNNVSIELLIRALEIPFQHSQGRLFRFECPQCFGCHTGIHPSTNLARCFNCKQNFNSIELTMLAKQLPFVAAVRFLQQQKTKLLRIQANTISPQIPRSGQPTSVGELLREIALAARRS